MTLKEWLEKIAEIESEDEIRSIKRFLENRAKEIRLSRLQGLGLGSRVRFNEQTRPTYLRGVTGTVTGFSGPDRVSIKVDPGQYAGRYGSGPIRSPLSLLELVTDERRDPFAGTGLAFDSEADE